MKLIEIKIENYRGIRNLVLPLDDLTILIGENNTGKSTILEALKLALTRGQSSKKSGQFDEYDFHLADATTTPQTSAEIKITLHFAESQENEWSNDILRQLQEVLQFNIATNCNHIWLQIVCGYNTVTGGIESKTLFLNDTGVELVNWKSNHLWALQKLAPFFMLSALRDATQEFGQRGQFWKSFLKSIQLPDAERIQIETELLRINTEIVAANQGLTQVTQQISNAKRLVPLDSTNPVVLEAIPTRIFDIVGKIQVHLKSASGAKLPLTRHGEGTQSLAVLMLFQAFAQANLAEVYDTDSVPILALEEPEAHLHPSAIRLLGQFLNEMQDQVIVTSHSGDLVSRVPAESLRRIYKRNGETVIGKIESTTLTDNERRQFDYHVRITKGAHLFARCWLLVEGQSEFWLFPKVAELLNLPADENNLAIIEFSQGGGPPPFIKAAQALGIQWFVVADGDQAGNNFIAAAQRCLSVGENPADRIFQLTTPDIEHDLWANGFQQVYENAISPTDLAMLQRTHNNAPQDYMDAVIKAAISKRNKPGLAVDMAIEMQLRGSQSVPASLRGIISRLQQMTGA